jgi:hypothetical protein
MPSLPRDLCAAVLPILIPLGAAGAPPSSHEPLFVRCQIDPGHIQSEQMIAALGVGEGRSALAPSNGPLRGSSAIAPGLLAFGLDWTKWPAIAALGESQSRSCPNGASL